MSGEAIGKASGGGPCITPASPAPPAACSGGPGLVSPDSLAPLFSVTHGPSEGGRVTRPAPPQWGGGGSATPAGRSRGAGSSAAPRARTAGRVPATPHASPAAG